jgi:negative regulator of flagellin synthesis FlgM
LAANGRTQAAGILIMQINGAHQIHGTQALNGPHFNHRPQQAAGSQSAQPVDQIDISPAALQASQDGGDVRADLVAQLKAEIAGGTYETPQKLDIALDRLLDTFS